MVRIETSENTFKENRDTFERPKKRSPFKKCCLFLVVIFLALAVVALIGVAKTGLVEVPFFSQIFYKTPVPTRQIEMEEKDIDQIGKDVTEKLIKSFGALDMETKEWRSALDEPEPPPKPSQISRIPWLPKDPDEDFKKVEFILTEKELTALIQQEMEGVKDSPIEKDVQFVITSQEIEVFGKLLKPVKGAITVGLKPQVKEGKIEMRLTKLRLGGLPAPVFVGNFLIDEFLTDKIRELNEELTEEAQITEVLLEDGRMIIRGKMRKNKF